MPSCLDDLAQWLGYVGEVLKKDIKFKLIFLPSCSILIGALLVKWLGHLAATQ